MTRESDNVTPGATAQHIQHVQARMRPETTECLRRVNKILDAEGEGNPKALMRCVKLLANELFGASIDLVELPVGISDGLSGLPDDVAAGAMDLAAGDQLAQADRELTLAVPTGDRCAKRFHLPDDGQAE